jgi:autotransporter-associated beta strand protein
VETNASSSHFFGTLSLAAPFANYTHIFNIDPDASLLVWGDIGQGIFAANLEKQGQGELAMISSNSFSGVFTISDGRVLASGAKPFGTEVGRTIVGQGATLVAYGGTNAEPFTISGHGYAEQGALVIQGSNYFNGSIILAANADIVTPATTNLAVFSGAISGPGGITKLGQGIVRLAGSDNNTYTSPTRVNEGALELTKTNANAIRGALDIGTNGLVRYLRDAQLSDLTPVSIVDGGQFRVLGHSDTIGSLSGYGIVELLDGTLITGNDNTATTFAGVISGIGGTLTKTGTNVFTLAGNNAYTGTTFAKGGTLLVRGNPAISPAMSNPA